MADCRPGWPLRVAALLTVLLVTPAAPGRAQSQVRPGKLRVTVQDQSGLVIVGAMVEVLADTEATEALAARATDEEGVAEFDLGAGRYVVLSYFEGFEPASLPNVQVRAGQTRRETLTLRIATLTEEVEVGRDRRTSGSDPRGDAFTTTLTQQEVDDLPDDPDELQAALEQAAGPGAVMRVNGFRGGGLPPKSQIREVRFRRNTFSAENHESGFVSIDVLTRPGMDSWRGNFTFGFRDDSMNARNAMAPRKVDEQQRRGGINLDGPLWRNHTSMSLSVDGFSAFDTQTILAVVPGGEVNGAFRRPNDRTNVDLRVEHALSKTQVLRGEFQHRGTTSERMGVGEIDLPERAYARDTTDRLFRLGVNGAVGKKYFNEFRFQTRWRDTDTVPFSTDPTIRVSGSFNAGGANTQGYRLQREYEIADNFDLAFGRHAVRVGLLAEGADVESTTVRNANGSFTFGSLEAYESNKPSTFTQRRGDPFVTYTMWRLGWFLQDDIRLRKDFTLSVGLRQEWQTHLGDGWNLAPRVGFAWSPFENGRTTFRGGVGIFFDWYEADTYEQTLQVDGERLKDVVIVNPPFPTLDGSGTAQIQPPGIIRAGDDLSMPTVRQAQIGMERAIGERARLNVSYQVRDGIDQFRAIATNLPESGQRPEPQYGNIQVIDSFGRLRANSIIVGGNYRLDWHRMFVAANYILSHSRNDGDGPLSLPADSRNPDEWGPARDDVTHRFSLFGNVDLRWNLRLGVNLRAESAPPYNITTGFDDNGDTIFTDRPAGMARNNGRGDGFTDLGLRLGWRVGFGPQRAQTGGGPGGGRGGGGGPQIVMRRGGEGDGPMMMGGGPSDRRYGVELYVQAFNVLNTTNLTNFNGVMSSSLFGQPNSARPPRRIEIGTRFNF